MKIEIPAPMFDVREANTWHGEYEDRAKAIHKTLIEVHKATAYNLHVRVFEVTCGGVSLFKYWCHNDYDLYRRAGQTAKVKIGMVEYPVHYAGGDEDDIRQDVSTAFGNWLVDKFGGEGW